MLCIPYGHNKVKCSCFKTFFFFFFPRTTTLSQWCTLQPQQINFRKFTRSSSTYGDFTLAWTQIQIQTNFYSKNLGPHFRGALLGLVPYILCVFVCVYLYQPQVVLLGWDWLLLSLWHTEPCNEVWIVVYIYIYIYKSLFFWLFCDFSSGFCTFSFWMVRLDNIASISKTLILIHGRFIHSKNEPWSKVRILLTNLKGGRMWPLRCLYWPRSGIWSTCPA